MGARDPVIVGIGLSDAPKAPHLDSIGHHVQAIQRALADCGGLSACHSGMRGLFLIVEAVRQLRGEAGAAQVPDAKLALAVGSGGWLSCIGAVVLGRA